MRAREWVLPLVCLLMALPARAAPPTVEVPPEVSPVGEYAIVNPKTDAKGITYIGLSGVQPFPSYLFKDSKTFVLPTRGLTAGKYLFTGVASLNDEHMTFQFYVVVGPATNGVHPKEPPDKKEPPVDPPAKPEVYYFLIVRPDGPASPEFTKIMQSPAWTTLRTAGHSFKDKTVTEAAALGITLPPGSPVFSVVTLKVSADGKRSDIVRGPVALPTTSEGIAKLPEGVK